ncbi:effector-associated constant component EACC1 [Streptomyces humidus]|uniref:effector-associated constant component EACC1 n=1 Tax=Streptomyces humidus TaxID=52259 RepID=UPI0033266A7E
MGNQDTLVTLEFSAQDADPEYVDEQLRLLIDELDELDLTGIEPVTVGPPPPGTRGADVVQLGTLLIGLGGGGALLPALVGVVQDWLGRRRSCTVRMKLGDDEIELTGACDDIQQRALEEFIRRRGE